MPDSAPMVLLPADKLEALREAVALVRKWDDAGGAERWMLRDASNAAVDLFDAATPAASVPAADILALADEWENYDAEGYAAGDGPDWWTRTDQLRALVAAAEQPDKGEGGQRGGKSQDTATPHEPSLTAPAAPPEPLCRCGPTPYPGTDAPMEDCPIHYPPAVPPRVPVNDEAEAAWQEWHAMSVGLLHELSGRERDETIWRSAWTASRAGRQA